MTELERLEKEKSEALGRWKESQTVENVRAFEKADRAVFDFLKNSSGKDEDPDAVFSSVAGVVRWLDENGWKASTYGKSVKSTVHRHIDQKKLRQRKGSYRLGDVFKYAEIHLKKMDPASPDGYAGADPVSGDEEEGESLSREKAKAETIKAKAQAAHWDMKTKILTGSHIEMAEFERALSARAAMFKQDLENFFRSMAGDRVSLVGGDSTKIPDLIEFDIKHLESCLGRYAEEREFTVSAPEEIKMVVGSD